MWICPRGSERTEEMDKDNKNDQKELTRRRRGEWKKGEIGENEYEKKK
jgi:hypothetical protein